MMEAGKPRPFRPGEDLKQAFVDARPLLARKGWEYSLLQQAPEKYASQLCTDCHDSHGKAGNPAMLKDATSETCLRCHGVGSLRAQFENHWGVGNALVRRCWECHSSHTH